MSNHRFDRWARTLPLKHKDNIVSSQFSDSPRFVASYEKEKNVDMFSLLSHGYATQWREEKDATKRVILESHDSDFLMRRYVLRGYLSKRKVMQTKPRFIMKQFRNIPAKIKARASSSDVERDLSRPELPSGTGSDINDLTKDSIQSQSCKSSCKSCSSCSAEEEINQEKESTKSLSEYSTCMKCFKAKKPDEQNKNNKTEPIMGKKKNKLMSDIKKEKEKTM